MNKRIIDIGKINERAANAGNFVAECEKNYNDKIAELADFAARKNKKIVLLSGPSSSGKTTTSEILIRKLAARGINSITVSTDDFFVNRDRTPKNADGTYDYESVEATDLRLLKDCLYELVSNGSAYFPKYNFITGESIRRGKIMRFPENGIIIVEGIHALNPLLTEDAFIKNSIKLYVCVFTEFALGGRVLLTAQELRLTRRILRDCITRGITPEQSVDVWKHVLGGEEKYIKPFIGSADFVIDTTHDYEPLVYKKLIMPKLRNIVEAVPQNMLGDYEKFGEIDKNLIPADSMLNEFVVR